jgi:hypothetical protein
LFSAISVNSGLFNEINSEVNNVYEGKIELYNSDDKSATAKVYINDYLFNSKGERFYNPAGTDKRSNANWIKLVNDRVTVGPKSYQAIKYTVAVPNDVTLKGTYWSIIMVEEISNESAENPSLDQKELVKISIKQVLRYGVQVANNINKKDSSINLVFKEIKINREDKTLDVNLENNGNLMVTPFMSLDVYDETGNFVKKVEANPFRIYPTCSVKYSLDIAELKAGTYNTIIVADDKNETILGKKFKLLV